MQPYAWYQPSWNEIFLPAGVLQPPNLDPDLPAYASFALMGSIVGDELENVLNSRGPPHPHPSLTSTHPHWPRVQGSTTMRMGTLTGGGRTRRRRAGRGPRTAPRASTPTSPTAGPRTTTTHQPSRPPPGPGSPAPSTLRPALFASSLHLPLQTVNPRTFSGSNMMDVAATEMTFDVRFLLLVSSEMRMGANDGLRPIGYSRASTAQSPRCPASPPTTQMRVRTLALDWRVEWRQCPFQCSLSNSGRAGARPWTPTRPTFGTSTTWPSRRYCMDLSCPIRSEMGMQTTGELECEPGDAAAARVRRHLQLPLLQAPL